MQHEPKKISQTKSFVEPLKAGEYNAVCMGYAAGAYRGKPYFKLVFDVNVWDDVPYRLNHNLNVKWLPTIYIAHIVGWMSNDHFLKNVTPTDVETPMDTKRDIDVPCNVVMGQPKEFNGVLYNELKFVLPHKVIEVPMWAKKNMESKADDIPWDFDDISKPLPQGKIKTDVQNNERYTDSELPF